MGRFNQYARKLDAILKDTRAEFVLANEKLRSAKATLDKWEHEARTTWGAKKIEAEHKLAVARDDYKAAQAAFKVEKQRIYDAYTKSVADLTEKYTAAVAAFYAMDNSKVNADAITMLQSGIMTASDYEKFADTFRDNGTMLRMGAKYAHEAAQNTNDPEQRQRMTVFAASIEHAEANANAAWDNLVRTANTYTCVRSGGDPDTVVKIMSNWDERMTDAVDEF